jgi:hypothetical protein
MIKIDFEVSKDGLVFRDAIHLPDDHGMSDAEIEAMKQARYNKWRDFIDNPPAVVDEPTEE